ncbi:hypothetical protein SAMN05421819_1549 [Bryocella elongata]|uniref:DUF503 domain-containing protein n=2 Tax=Bryocella elongata TaxID=863522 RepID=A0A1H5WFH4_9BACT|nr:hypothetical protein SAMN05421819_1549 [Bryocella elongata]
MAAKEATAKRRNVFSDNNVYTRPTGYCPPVAARPMPIASLTLELAIEHAQSLKDRRQAVRSLKDKLRHGFNISVAELDDAMVWNRATIGVAAISGSSAYLAGQLREVEEAARRIANGLGCEIVDSFIEADVELPEG